MQVLRLESLKKMRRQNNTIWDTSVRYILFIALAPLAIASILYFNISFSTTNDLMYDQSRELNKQIVLNFENYINSLIDTSDYIEAQIETLDVISNNQDLYLNFQLATELQKDVESVELYYDSGLLIMEEIESKPRNVALNPWFEAAISNKNVNNFSKIKGVYDGNDEDVIALSKFVKMHANGEEVDGVLRIDINFNRIEELINITKLGNYGAIIFINENDEVIYSSADDVNLYETNEFKNRVLGEFMTTINDNSMFANINIISNTRWRMVTYLNRNILTEVKSNYITYFLIVLLFAAILAIGLAFRFTRKITQPIEKLKNTLLEIEPVDLHLSISDDDYEEIRVLNETINNMAERIKNLMDFVIKEQEEKTELELEILQHQINPHFLYNTLETIIVLSENDMKQEVTNTIIALSRYFRINLSGGDKYIPVKLELEQIENYLKIQKARYQTRFDYEIIRNPSYYGYEVLKLILQPLVENAIYHGTSAYEESHIKITHEIDDDFYYLRVSNSGYGLTDEQIEIIYQKMKSKSPSKNVGLRNVYERIKLHYGNRAELMIEVDEDSYTIVSIKLPIDKLKEINL